MDPRRVDSAHDARSAGSHSAGPFREAIASVSVSPLDPPPSGLTLPHHALALDLVAKGLALARGGAYEGIVLVSPDHFRRAKTAAAVATRYFLTVLGPVPTDREASTQLARTFPSDRLRFEDGLPVLPSLGNLLFDQGRREVGGVLLEARFFEQGIFATRLLSAGNLFREWKIANAAPARQPENPAPNPR